MRSQSVHYICHMAVQKVQAFCAGMKYTIAYLYMDSRKYAACLFKPLQKFLSKSLSLLVLSRQAFELWKLIPRTT